MGNPDWRQRIVCDANLHHGEPCISGTRISVSVLVASLADLSMDELLGEYPQLKREMCRQPCFMRPKRHRAHW